MKEIKDLRSSGGGPTVGIKFLGMMETAKQKSDPPVRMALYLTESIDELRDDLAILKSQISHIQKNPLLRFCEWLVNRFRGR